MNRNQGKHWNYLNVFIFFCLCNTFKITLFFPLVSWYSAWSYAILGNERRRFKFQNSTMLAWIYPTSHSLGIFNETRISPCSLKTEGHRGLDDHGSLLETLEWVLTFQHISIFYSTFDFPWPGASFRQAESPHLHKVMLVVLPWHVVPSPGMLTVNVRNCCCKRNSMGCQHFNSWESCKSASCFYLLHIELCTAGCRCRSRKAKSK